MEPFQMTSSSRANAVVDTLVAGVPMARRAAKELAARLLGHPDWSTLTAAVRAARIDDLTDERAGARVANARRAHQVEVVMAALDIAELEADAIVDSLQPTAERIGSSLGDWRRARAERLFPCDPSELDASIDATMRAVLGDDMPEGMTGAELLEAARVMHPVPDDVLAHACERAGWIIGDRNTNPERTRHGEWMFDVRDPDDGRAIPCFGATVAYVPGDVGDEAVETLLNSLGETYGEAVVLFARSMVKEVAGRYVVFGGFHLVGGEPAPFVWAPGGFGRVREQRGWSPPEVDRGFAERFGWPDPELSLLIEFARDYPHLGDTGVQFQISELRVRDGWTVMMTSVADD